MRLLLTLRWSAVVYLGQLALRLLSRLRCNFFFSHRFQLNIDKTFICDKLYLFIRWSTQAQSSWLLDRSFLFIDVLWCVFRVCFVVVAHGLVMNDRELVECEGVCDGAVNYNTLFFFVCARAHFNSLVWFVYICVCVCVWVGVCVCVGFVCFLDPYVFGWGRSCKGKICLQTLFMKFKNEKKVKNINIKSKWCSWSINAFGLEWKSKNKMEMRVCAWWG